jgi:hemoglobin/transferrin/lactoferrin receptor protein
MKHRIIIMTILAVTVISSDLLAENYSGYITDKAHGKPIVGVTVTVKHTNIAVQTDKNGFFEIKNVQPPCTVMVSHVGYTGQNNIVLSATGENKIGLNQAYNILNSMVVTATRYDKEAYKTSQPINAVGSEELASQGTTIVSDAIRTLPGIDMNDAGPFRARPVIRGLYGTRVLVLVDGSRLNDQRDVADFAGASMSLVDVNEIERIEVVNGPSSVLYGSDAMGGVINILTRRGQFTDRIMPIGKFTTRYSSADEQSSVRLDAGISAPKWVITGGYQFREAQRDYILPDGWTEKDERYAVFNQDFYDQLNADQGTVFSSKRLANSEARIENYDAQLDYKFNKSHRVNLDYGSFSARDIGYPGVPNESTPYLFAYPSHDRDNFAVTYTGTNLTGRLARLEGKFYYEKISKDFLTDFYDQVSFPAGPGATGYIETTVNHTEVEKFGLNFQELYVFSDDVVFTFGIDSWQEKIDGASKTRIRFEGFGPFPVYETSTSASVPKNQWWSAGAYASGEIHFDKLRINPGLRVDGFWISTDETAGYVDDDDRPLPTQDENYSAVNGSLGLVMPIKGGVNAVADIGTAYRVPNVVERFYHGSASGRETRPNPDIKPERSVTVNAGIKGVHPHISYSIIGFYSDYKDFTQLVNFDSMMVRPGVYQALWRYDNIQDVTIYGMETFVEGSLENGLYGVLGLSYQHGQNKTDDQPLFVSPFKTTATLGYRFPEHDLFAELTLRRSEKQNRVPDVAALEDIPTAAFTVLNANTGIRLYNQIRLSVAVNNIFDEVYSEPFNGRNPDNPIPEPGRNFIVSLSAGI